MIGEWGLANEAPVLRRKVSCSKSLTYIFISKRQNQRLSMAALKDRINYFFRLGQYTATKNNDLYRFEHNWQKYKEVLQSIH